MEGLLMAGLAQLLPQFRAWSEPREHEESPFRLACTLDLGASRVEFEEAWGEHPLPDELIELWTHCRTARLFEDVDYGQWGLELLRPWASAARTAEERAARPDDLGPSDIVVGQFLGDHELLVLAGEEGGNGEVLVALPLDPRRGWHRAASSLHAFLSGYLDTVGNKYWEYPQ